MHEKGQAILEFALAMPFLLMFIFFIVDCGLFAFSYVSATNAVREGARCAAVGGTNSAVATRVANTSGGLNATTEVTPNAYSPGATPSVGGNVTVAASYTYNWITPIDLVPGISSTSTFTKSVQMRMETASATKSSC
ncbi:MAG: TadE/TadG family type IV pilus assembly protein [Dehalococcoidia bacterium]